MVLTKVDVLAQGVAKGCRSAVSLHSHTSCSRESLAFLPEWMNRTRVLRTLFQRDVRRYRVEHGADLDFEQAFWRPPLSPLEVCESEAAQISCVLAIDPLVSLTDHDSIEGPMSLQGASLWRRVPVSTEWTVPFGRSIVHLGVHNLPPEAAPGLLAAFAEHRARPGDEGLGELLSLLDAMPGVLTVLNHPYWNGDVNDVLPESAVSDFLDRHGRWIHALELNAYRRWPENQAVMALAHRRGYPLVAGGDRHGHAPNAMLCLSAASTFDEFVDEIRVGRRSHVLILPEYLEQTFREIDAVSDILGRHGAHADRGHWANRVFITGDGGRVRPFADVWDGGPPLWMRSFVALLGFLRSRPARPVIRFALAGGVARLF